jgi:hypothetical protein
MRLPGYRVWDNIISWDDQCQLCLQVRFGSRNGEKRAYLTSVVVQEGTGTLVDLTLAGGKLVISSTNDSPPGTYILSGRVTEVTPTGQVPVEGADVWYTSAGIGQIARGTDKDGFYQLRGLYEERASVAVFKRTVRYASDVENVVINGNTRFDIVIQQR